MSQNNQNDRNTPNGRSDQNNQSNQSNQSDQSNQNNQSNQSTPSTQSTQSDQSNQNNRSNQSDQSTPSGQNNQNNQSTPSTPSTPNTPSTPPPPKNQHLFLPQHGHYRHLRVYKAAEALYDITYIFCRRFLIERVDRTVDQMIQAARSGKQNIAEGNQAATTSSETEIKLTNVAKASLEELLVDYEDYLRTRHLQQWDPQHPRYAKMRSWTRTAEFSASYAFMANKMNDEELANLGITLCHQVIYMLEKLLSTLQDRFVTQGGIKERMHAARTGYRQEQDEELSQLRQLVPQLKTENDKLKAEIAQLNAEIAQLKTTNAQLEAEIARLRTLLKTN